MTNILFLACLIAIILNTAMAVLMLQIKSYPLLLLNIGCCLWNCSTILVKVWA